LTKQPGGEVPSTELSLGVGVLDLSQAQEPWAQQWVVLDTVVSFSGGGKAGFYSEAVRSGPANPNRGRKGILYLHPLTQQKPARMARNVALAETSSTLKMGVSGNRDVDGDWALVVKVDGQPLEDPKNIVGTEGWQDLAFDISAFSNQTVLIEIEVRANNWYYEFAFFDYVRIEGEKSPKVDVSTLLAPPPGLIAHWKFDEGGGSLVHDSSGYGNDGIIQGASWVRGRFGNALTFDGKEDWVQADSSQSLDTKNEITLEAWINPREGPPQPILEYNDGAHFGVHVWQWNRWSDLFVNFMHTKGSQLLTAPGVMTTGWQHIAAVYDGTHGKLYRNGDLVASKKMGKLILQTSFDFYIGSRPSERRYFNGFIDEVRIYNRALSQTEIKEDMKVTQPGFGPRLPKDAFRLSTGALILGELLNFDGKTLRIRTETGVIEKRREEITTILLGITP